MLGICIFLAGALVLICPPVFHKLIKTTSEEEWEGNDEFYSTCLDGLQGIVTLKAFNANERHRQKVEIQSEKMRKKTMANLVRTTLNSRVMELLISVGEIVSVLVGIWLYGRGTLGVAELTILFFTMQAWSEGVRQIFGAWLRGNRGAAGYESILEIMDTECAYSLAPLKREAFFKCEPTGSRAEQGDVFQAPPRNEAVLKYSTKIHTAGVETKMGEIEFTHVSFSYNDDYPVLRDVSFKVEEGTRTALVGSSGSGKSTIARLLFGFYKPQSGSIKVCGQELDAGTVSEIQNQITVIWQDCHIFHTSCMENIKMARPAATDEEVYEAAKKANIHEMIMQLPEGYQTVIGDGGRSFSGGEKQRIAIARAFLRNAPILILDEATSSLDRRNEMEIQECIQELSVGKTVLTIAHRLDTVREADQICVMESGKIVERGTHSELMKNGERYQELMGAGNV